MLPPWKPACAGILAVGAPLAFLAIAAGVTDLSELQVARRVLPPAITWALAGAVTVVALVFAAWLALNTLLKFSHRAVAALFGVIALAIFVAVGATGSGSFAKLYALLGGEIPDRINHASRWMGALGSSSSLLIVATLGHLVPGEATTSAEELRARITAARELLYLSAVGLAAGAIATFARLTLQVDPTLEEEGRKAALVVIQAATIGYGGFFTLVLFGAYIPVSHMISKASAMLADSLEISTEPSARAKWLEEHGLQDKALAKVLKFLVPFLPLLTSTLSAPLAELLKKLLE